MMQRWPRILFLAPGAVALMAGFLAGLERLGVTLPLSANSFAQAHGPLMTIGFLSTVIGLERAVALGRDWAFLAPVFSGLGALAFLAGLPAASTIMAVGAVILAAAGLDAWRRHPALYSSIMALAAILGALASILWVAGFDIPRIVSLWTAFLVLTIAGERLELTRFLPPSKLRSASLAALAVAVAALSLSVLLSQDMAARLFGAALLCLAVWMLVFDIARRNVRQTGLTRFIGFALLLGYVWLGVGGIALLHHGMPSGGFEYDAVLHIVFVGFVFSMIFGHAPVILPAVLKRQAPYHPLMLLWLLALHAGLILRIAGDHASDMFLRQAGGILNVTAILLFIATVAARTLMASRD